MRAYGITHALTWTALLVGRVSATYWLNQLDGYDSLPHCAEDPISSIVRDMVSGCGDGGRATSYSCFCTRKSEEFRGIIASAVAVTCKNSGTEVASATSIFHEYCQLGKNDQTTSETDSEPTTTEAILSTTKSSSHTQASSTDDDPNTTRTAENTSPRQLAETAMTSLPLTSFFSTPSPTRVESSSAAPNSVDSTLSTGSKVAMGVCIPVAALSLLVAGCVLYRRRKSRSGHRDHDRIILESRDCHQAYPKPSISSRSMNTGDFPHDADAIGNCPYHASACLGRRASPIAYEKPELDGGISVVELPPDASRRRHELE